MNAVLDSLNGNLDYIKILNNKNTSLITGLNDSAKAMFALAICVSKKSSGLILTKTLRNAQKIVGDLNFFNSNYKVCYLPSYDLNYYDISSESREDENERINIFKKVLDKENIIVVSTVENFMQNILKESININSFLKVSNSDNINLTDLIKSITKLGYEKCDSVCGKGTFSVRGEILDVFPVNMDLPVRIEFCFDEINSIRTFDALSQRSIVFLKDVSIYKTEENIISNEKISEVIIELEKLLKKDGIDINQKEIIEKDIEKLKNGDYKKLISKYFKLFQNEEYNLFNFFKDNNFEIFIDEYERLIEKSNNLLYENEETISHLVSKNFILSEYINSYMPFDLIYKKEQKNYKFYLLQKLDEISINDIDRFGFDVKEANIYRNSLANVLPTDLKRNEGKIILLTVSTDVRKNQIIDILASNNFNFREIKSIDEISSKEACIYVLKGIISSGFESENLDFTILAEQVVGVIKGSRRNNQKSVGTSISSYEELNIGDYVVHENYGIGIYAGINSINVQGVIKDYIKVEYASNGVLYIPVNQLYLVKKYEVDENSKIKLNSLNSKSWENTKSKVKKYVTEVAKDLVRLYAKRERKNGFCFLKDTPWQKEFEDSFPYELTNDQKVAVEEIKEDMESKNIMDRLLLGDVGYGKTEVALRCAFKAVMSGKQVAYLVPTTVLCLQQYNTFKERMENFGIKVEMLSRFKTKKEQNAILKGLKTGEIDIVIGTHRILSKDVEFKDLGFLVIDEEHRFGVSAKEQIKKIKEDVDVLSMSATPIPRTLNMSLIGVRKMSNLTEPPIDRLPVHTYVMEYDEEIIKDAIKRELLRDGQVIYLSNRVDKIEEVTEKVKKLVESNVRVSFAHGQMDPSLMEDIMLKFINHEIDILVCTTILESGIDIPNANLIIVENADRLGLAQLYQIRGRVGRSNKLGYAYITYEKNKQISEISEKRLKAIRDFTEFGSGYKIALRDLEIRGAGSLLGNIQHGHMVSVGYNMYISMLDRALKEENGLIENNNNSNSVIDDFEVKIDLDVSAYISDSYIENQVQKINMYQKISDIKNSEDSMDIIDEMIDRYGALPQEVENLIKIVEIRNKCRELGISKVYKKNNFLFFEPSNLKFLLTNKKSNDILIFVQNKLLEVENILKK